MKTSPINILLIESFGKTNRILDQLLTENGYQTKTLNEIEPAIENIINQSVDLVICDNQVNEHNGFEVFKILLNYLRTYGVPFFLVFDSFEKEDMLIGLEIGIDNFIVSPINTESVCYKIENQLNKRKELNVFKLDDFLDYFHNSPVAMFYIEANKISLVNKSFHKLHNGCTSNLFESRLDSVFAVSDDKQNELNYRRFMNRITNHCKLFRVPCCSNHNDSFDISLYRSKNHGTTQVFAEILPSSFAKIIENNSDKEARGMINSNIAYAGQTQPSYSENIKLTAREQELFKLSAKGLPIKNIAAELGLSERTVEKHRANIMAKVNAKNMLEAIIRIQTANRNNDSI